MEHYRYTHASDSIISMITAVTRDESLRSNLNYKSPGWNPLHNKAPIPPIGSQLLEIECS